MKNVLIYAPNAPISGVTNAIYTVHKEMDKKKIRLSTITWSENQKLIELSKTFNGTFYPFKIFFLKHPFKFYKNLKDIFKNNEIDTVVFNLSSLMSMCPIVLAEKYNIHNIIVYSHSSRIEANTSVKRTFLTIIHRMNRLMLKTCSITKLACSQKAGEWMYGKNAKFTIIKNAIDLEKFQYNYETRLKIRTDFKIGNAIVLGNVGRLSYPKNQLFLINVFSEFVRRNPNSYLWIIGDGLLKDKLMEEICRLKLENRVILLGKRNDVSDLLNAMDLFLLPSIFEGMPVSAIEAQANGLPCIISDSIDASVVINNNVLQKSIGDNIDSWEDAIAKQLFIGRYKDSKKNLTAKGWNIKNVTELLEEIYSS